MLDMSALMVSRVICQRHGFTATVGSAVQFALDYYECPSCVRIQDEEWAASRRPCCSRANIDCCGHGEPDEDDRVFYVELKSPNYCGHRPELDFCPCGKPEHHDEPPF